MPVRNSILIFFLIVLIPPLSAQERLMRGTVVDSADGSPLAFVNVTYGSPPRGTTTDIDGKFTLQVPPGIREVHFSYVGYHPATLEVSDSNADSSVVIALEQRPYHLEGVVIKPGENPANRIIKRAFRNRSKNNPENLASFSYRSYNKIMFMIDSTERAQAAGKVDSSIIRLRQTLDKQHLMLMETVSRRKYMSPGRNREDVLASRVSGFKDPSLSFLATQFQSFSFYNDFIELGNDRYLNPISKNSWNKYFFLLEDTLFTPRQDTVYVISYRPGRGRIFEGLEGVMHINSRGYALQTVIAEPWDPPADLSIRIQQKYELVDGRQWFPYQLNTRLKFKNVLLTGKDQDYYLVGEGKTYIYNIRLNPDLDRSDFGHVEVSVPAGAYERSGSFWRDHRRMALTGKDRRTYRVLDSLGQAHYFDQRLDLFETLSTGYLPAGVVDFNLMKILDFNKYEGLRLGLGLKTSDQVSEVYALGGFLGYGFRDKKLKYGGNLELKPHPESETLLEMTYADDVVETGDYWFLNEKSFLSSEAYRDYLVESMDRVEEASVSLTFRTLDYLKVQGFLQHSRVNPYSDYLFEMGDRLFSGTFRITEAGLRLRYAYGEGFIHTHRGKFSLGTRAPVLYANIIRGIDGMKGDFQYTKYEGALSKTIQSRTLGNTSVKFTSGFARGEVPAFNLYSGHGSFGSKFAIYSGSSFATMRLDEFRVSSFFSAFISHDFRTFLQGSDIFNPHLIWVNNLGWGWLDDSAVHQGVDFKAYDKGYFETGLLFDRLISTGLFHYGLGVFYRYGPYGFDRPARNFAFKFSFRLAFN
ncbi:MAG TPA: DUF5686 family protein [Bacteroidales bacterium]|nr:DUF5686 family protein [Bacteroidales bacterium]